MNPIVNVGIKAARQAGAIMLRYVDQLDRLSVEKKGRNDFVSEVDRMAEEAIIELVQSKYPGHRILAEEGGETDALKDATDEYRWIIDPLDGTTNFLHGNPHFCVSIGVEKSGVLEHAVIYDPLRNEMYNASRNEGAQLNGRRIRVSAQPSLRNSLVTTGYPSRNLDNYDTWLACSNLVSRKAAGIRHTGSAALDLAFVASGRVDAFWEPGLNPWDLAAGCLLVREARGLVSDLAGGQDFLDNGSVIAAGSGIFNELLALLKGGGSDCFARAA